jgi:hypothetical protein
MQIIHVLSVSLGSKALEVNVSHLRCLICLGLLLPALPIIAAGGDAKQKAEAELLLVHQEDRRAHFQRDVKAVLAHVGPQLIDVRDGKIQVMSLEQVRTKFTDYFSNTEFSAWDDVEPPIVRGSEDGRIGWMIVRVHIAYTQVDGAGKKTRSDSTMAWMSAYEKRNGVWIMTAVTSTTESK